MDRPFGLRQAAPRAQPLSLFVGGGSSQAAALVAGSAPICCIRPIWSRDPQSWAILPPEMRMKAVPSTEKCLPLAGTLMKSPVWAPAARPARGLTA
jgi:hypothetical protein